MQQHNPFRSAVENQEPQLATLEISAGQGSTAQSAIVLCDIRFGRSRFKLAHFTVYAAISHAEISVRTMPPNLSTRSRFADHVNSTSKTVEVRETDRRKTTTKSNGSVNLSVSTKALAGNAAAGFKGQQGKAKETETIISSKFERAMVRAKGEAQWTVGEFSDSQPLQGKYIGDEPICVIESVSNIDEITINVSIPKSNFLVEKVTDNITGNEIEISKGKRKLIEILTVKAIEKEGDALVISQGTLKRQ